MRNPERCVAAGVLGLLAACASASPSLMPERRGGIVHFRIEAPGATRVAVVGTFNDWNPLAHPLTSRDGRLWEGAVALPPGRHSFTFLVDDRPVRPPAAPFYEEDGFGGQNGVLEIP